MGHHRIVLILEGILRVEQILTRGQVQSFPLPLANLSDGSDFGGTESDFLDLVVSAYTSNTRSKHLGRAPLVWWRLSAATWAIALELRL